MFNGIYIKCLVPDKYLTVGSLTSNTFTMPIFDYGYTINYSYSDAAYDSISASGQVFPNYKLAKKLSLIIKYQFNWSGLVESEKIIVENFIKSFGNSFQPFTLQIFTSDINHLDYEMIIDSDTVSISKDRFDLYNVSFSTIQLEG